MDIGRSNEAAPMVIVTGALGGLGRAISDELHAIGWSVVGMDHPEAIRSRADASIPWSLLPADITSKSELESAFAAAAEQPGTLAALVNCAGVSADEVLAHLSIDRLRSTIEVNLIAAVAAMSLFVKHWIATEGGRDPSDTGAIVNISSLSAYGAIAGQSAYAASKAGLVAATRVAARELGPLGIRVNAILPSFIATPLTGDASDETRAGLLSRTPLGRFPHLDEVAGTVRWLLSSEASYVSGAELRVSGGRLI